MAYLLLVLCTLIGWSQAFLPSPSLEVEGLTHADITEEALLAVAMDACREEAQNEGRTFNPPALLNPESLLRACLGVSEEADLSGSKFRELLNEIISENIFIDRDQPFSSAHHFNDEVIERGRDIITQGVSIVRASLRQDNLQAARRALGAVTHTLQDFYSHSNWFELGNLDPYPNLLRPDLPLQNLADANTPTCNDCQEKVCPNVILPEILSTNTLTSGYLSFTPQGKCNHGDSIMGGINKDFGGGGLTSDGTDPHLAAFAVAAEATKDLLQNIRIAFGNTVFLRMLGITRSTVLCFVIDTTASMTDDVAEVRRLTTKIIDETRGTPNEPSLYILVEFNDPEVGPVTSTTDPEEMKRVVNALTVSGGGDIPELSLSGIRLALTTAPPSSDIFVFTDAPPKDTELLDTVISLVESTRSKVTSLLTNALNRRRTRRSALTNPTNSVYQQLAQLSGGQVIEVTKNTLPLATAVIEDSITSSMVTVLQVESTRPDTFSFLLDPRLQNVTLYITGLSINFTLQNPAGVAQNDTAGSGPLASVFPVGNLYRVSLNEGNLTGRWQITIRSPQAYSLRVTGRSALNFMSQFVEVFDGPHPGFAPIAARPPAGQNATLLITVTGVDMLFGVEVGLVSADGELLRNTSVTRLREGTYLARVLHLPDVPFTLLLMGQEADGRPFQRQSSTQIQASQITVQVQRTVVLAPGESITVPFTVETRGIEGAINISARDDQGFVTAVNNRLNVGAAGNATGLVSLSVPTGTPSGTTSVVTIDAESSATRQSNFALLRVSVIQRDIDVTPPVCRVLNESLDCPVPCGNATWEVTLLMSDGNGTGLRDPHISITIPDTPINETSTAIIDQVKDENGYNATLLTYRASCCVTNVEISAVDNEGNVGRCDFSIRRPSTTGPPQTTISSTTSHPTTSRPSSNISPTAPSNGPRLTVSLWTTLLLLALTALML
ncbi:von Willebrand factor A domain-containing protein 7-like [Colossoma macropomum]|uniref:von Willebrand factor A domain-containing protein 7-like n=1 Tax=Colossoma macropomum TaxID=42526 RepID=UPI00186419E9|nr:von Willebrand factor A domain-containing protein 7-like [Colossoma macropomum]